MMNGAAKPKKKVLISGGLAVGGPQTHVCLLCETLLDSGAEVTIVAAATNWDSASLSALKASGVRIIVPYFGFGKLGFLGKLFCLAVWPLLLRRDFDVVYCIGEGRMHLLACIFRKRNAIRIYHEIAECPKHNSIAHQVGMQMDAFIANSYQVQGSMCEMFAGHPVRRIPFFTKTGTLTSSNNSRSPDRKLRVAYLGRLASHKRPSELIAAWNEFQHHEYLGPSELHFYGGDCGTGLQSQLESDAVTHGVRDLVRVHGVYNNDQLSAILKEIDLVVLPSTYEGLPLVLVEAMSRGIPVVATSAGGTGEFAIENPDVAITPGTGWPEFVVGLQTMGRKIRTGAVDASRLRNWTESRYGHDCVSRCWIQAILQPEEFFTDLDSPSIRDNRTLANDRMHQRFPIY